MVLLFSIRTGLSDLDRPWRLSFSGLHFGRRHGRRYGTKGPTARFLLCRFQFLVLDDQKLIFPDLIAASFVMGFDDLSGDGIHKLMAQSIAGLSIDLPE
jgi:hypothetical protein